MSVVVAVVGNSACWLMSMSRANVHSVNSSLTPAPWSQITADAAVLCCCCVLQCAMARLPSNPELLLLHANFLIEVHKDGQAAHAQIQQAQKSNPGLLDSYSIYAAQQMSKKLQKGNPAAAVS